jgi:hypothetical protein
MQRAGRFGGKSTLAAEPALFVYLPDSLGAGERKKFGQVTFGQAAVWGR